MEQCTEGVNHYSSTPDYTAQCTSDGVAVIDVYAHDCSFSAVPEIAGGVPQECREWNGVGMTAHFQYIVPCSIANQDFCVDEAICAPEARLDYKSVDGGLGDYASMPVTILEQGGSTVDFQIDQTWKYEDIGWIAVDYIPAGNAGDTSLCIPFEGISSGDSTPPFKAQCVNGIAEIDVYAYDCEFTGVPNIDASVPGACQPLVDVGKKVHYHFTVPCLCMDTADLPASTYVPPHEQSGNMSSTSAAATTSSSSGTSSEHTAPNEVTCTQSLFEDYESPEQSASWTDGTEYTDASLGTFLGRFGVDHAEVSKTFVVPSDSDSVTLTFDFYDVNGSPTQTDVVMMGVQNTYLDLKLFQNINGVVNYNDIALGYTKNAANTMYHVTATIPKSWYEGYAYRLPISFNLQTNKSVDDISQDSFGVDNLRIVANCDRRRLEKREEPKEGEFYCSIKDFPCDGGKSVNICHFSNKDGFTTFCIPEADSEILRFYSQDYCGPCVGGLGTKQAH